MPPCSLKLVRAILLASPSLAVLIVWMTMPSGVAQSSDEDWGQEASSTRRFATSAEVSRVVDGLKKTCDDFKISFVGSGDFHPDRLAITGDAMFSSADQMLVFHQRTSHVAAYNNQAATHSLERPLTGLSISQWSAGRAIKIGTAFRQIIAGASPVEFGPPITKYEPPDERGQHDQDGHWLITWKRVDAKGYPFCSDNVSLELSESHGLINATVDLDSDYVEAEGEPMTAPEAIAIARKNNPSKGNASLNTGDYALGTSALEIVKPRNHPSRLAWVVWFNPAHALKAGGQASLYPIALWVDAHTGKIIGNDVLLF